MKQNSITITLEQWQDLPYLIYNLTSSFTDEINKIQTESLKKDNSNG